MTHAERELLLAMAKAIMGRLLAAPDIRRLSSAIKAVEDEKDSERHL